jgi:hypothetical protein
MKCNLKQVRFRADYGGSDVLIFDYEVIVNYKGDIKKLFEGIREALEKKVHKDLDKRMKFEQKIMGLDLHEKTN